MLYVLHVFRVPSYYHYCYYSYSAGCLLGGTLTIDYLQGICLSLKILEYDEDHTRYTKLIYCSYMCVCVCVC